MIRYYQTYTAPQAQKGVGKNMSTQKPSFASSFLALMEGILELFSLVGYEETSPEKASAWSNQTPGR